MSLKSLIAGAAHQLGAVTGFSASRAKAIRAGRILMFHGVGDADYSEKDFESHLRFFAHNFSIVSLAAIAQAINSRRPLTNEVVLTFDDGLRNNFSSVYPILKRLNLTATFFVCPALIEHQRWLWNHEARARLRCLTPEQRKKLLPQFKVQNGADVEQIIDWMKTLPLKEREAAEGSIRDATSAFRPSSEQQQKSDIMSWDELRSLDSKVITIGSHTVNHPILSTLESEQLRFEIFESRRLLEEKLGRTVDQFCYPNGAHNPGVVEEVRKHYRIAVTTEPGFVDGANDLLQLPRIGIVPQPLLSWRMHRPTA